jgi:hypothetical protein
MEFTVGGLTNATEEIQKANAYPLIRLFTVGQGTGKTARAKNPLEDLQTIQQNWSVTSNKTINGDNIFSAVCWIFGRTIFDKLGGKVPLGLVSNNWVGSSCEIYSYVHTTFPYSCGSSPFLYLKGGTPIEHWATPDAFASCGRTDTDSYLYNAM